MKKVKINKTLIEKYKKISENPNFEQDHYSRTATGIYKIGHDGIRLTKWLVYFDRSYFESTGCYDLLSSVLKCSNEIT